MFTNYENKLIKNIDNKVKKNRWFVIASGPSLIKEDVEKLKSENVLAINDNYLIAPFAEALYFCDQKWFNWHKDEPEFKAFKGKKYSQCSSWDNKDEAIAQGVTFIDSEAKSGLSKDPNVIYQGSNSGYQAINLAYHLGAEQIILLGYDMQANDKGHWFGEHPDKIRSNYNSFIGYYNRMAPEAEKMGLEIINCSRQTALTCFTRQSLEQVL